MAISFSEAGNNIMPIFRVLSNLGSPTNEKHLKMRKRFIQQLRIGQVPIHDLEINHKSRDSYVHRIRSLKEVFTTPEYCSKIFGILRDKILSGEKATGLPTMDLRQIFVLCQVCLGLNIGYDRLHTMANNDRMQRTLMGIEAEIGY